MDRTVGNVLRISAASFAALTVGYVVRKTSQTRKINARKKNKLKLKEKLDKITQPKRSSSVQSGMSSRASKIYGKRPSVQENGPSYQLPDSLPTEESLSLHDLSTEIDAPVCADFLIGIEYIDNNILVKRSLLGLIDLMQKNVPTYLKKIRNEFRAKRRWILKINNSQYKSYVADHLEKYTNAENVAKENLQNVLESNGVSLKSFFASVRYYEDPEIQKQLHSIDYTQSESNESDLRENEVSQDIDPQMLEYLLEQKAQLLESQKVCDKMRDFLVTEINVTDDLFLRFGYEEQDMIASYKKYSRRSGIIRQKNRILEAKRRLMPLKSSSILT